MFANVGGTLRFLGLGHSVGAWVALFQGAKALVLGLILAGYWWSLAVQKVLRVEIALFSLSGLRLVPIILVSVAQVAGFGLSMLGMALSTQQYFVVTCCHFSSFEIRRSHGEIGIFLQIGVASVGDFHFIVGGDGSGCCLHLTLPLLHCL